MLATVDETKEYLGITDSSNDDFLASQIQLISDAVEGYCGRIFSLGTYTETFFSDEFTKPLREIRTFHYPVTGLTSATDENGDPIDISGARAATQTGTLVNPAGWFYGYKQIVLVYDAGYATIPALIKTTVIALVGQRYNKKISGVNLDFGSDVQRISIPGTISIDFDYSLDSNSRKNSYGVLLGSYTNVLDPYRSERVVTGTGRNVYIV